jgi:polyisoprenoid-binding protein YceI
MDALLCALWMLQVAVPPSAQISPEETGTTQQIEIDSMHSAAGFTVHPLWRSAMVGTFDSPTGALDKLADGRWRIDFSLQAASVAFTDSQRITTMTRSEAFFDAAHQPIVHFRSNPFYATFLRDGGTLSGVLDLRGVSKPVDFVFAKADCQQPGVACPIRATGKISRSAFGMTRYKLVLGDDVDIEVDVRLHASP